MSEIRVIIKRPGEAAFETMVENELRPLQEWVGGHIETYALGWRPETIVICNEEGKLEGLPYNCRWGNENFVGTILLVGVDGEEFADCPVRLKTAAAVWPELKGTKKGKRNDGFAILARESTAYTERGRQKTRRDANNNK